MKINNLAKYFLGFLVVAGTSYFFISEFYYNFYSISKFKININWFYLFISQLLLILTALSGTYFWQLLLKTTTLQQIKFRESVAVVNTSQMTKYLPGKVWSFAFQMLLLSKRGISGTVVLYINLFLLITSLFASTFWGLLYFVLFSTAHNKFWMLIFIVFLITYLGFILFNQRCLKILVTVFEKLFKRTINCTRIDIKWIVLFQGLYLLVNAAFGITGYLLALGLGFSVSTQDVFAIAAFLIIADAIGFIVLIAPGGLGVRESIMFALLAALGDKNLALILPIGTRLMGMISDFLLGGIGFIFLKKTYSGSKNVGDEEKLK
jgi:uncharacterized membrane protein YbhN (UPF0104 family)